ncbi:DUF1127 domain-containing protein [Cognatishimia sp. D5M38]|uniref:DUF1127 domain-containing protein n=1 Tax=Cognatishimia coralii TaxID=3083254 RepID=A0ABU8QFQ9_9RHOB
MANIDVAARPQTTLLGTLAAPFVALGNAIIAHGEAVADYRAERFHLNLTDEELAQRGLNRKDQVRKAFAPYMSF